MSFLHGVLIVMLLLKFSNNLDAEALNETTSTTETSVSESCKLIVTQYSVIVTLLYVQIVSRVTVIYL